MAHHVELDVALQRPQKQTAKYRLSRWQSLLLLIKTIVSVAVHRSWTPSTWKWGTEEAYILLKTFSRYINITDL
jgi:hypothetical protein